MTSEYTHYDATYEQRFKDAQQADYKFTRKEVNPLPNAIYKQPIQYYDSQVKNSHLYPNIGLIKSVDYETKPPNIGAMIDKSIEENKVYALGPFVMQQRYYNYKS
jgi:hypothetical protein